MRPYVPAGVVLLLIVPVLLSCGADQPARTPVTHTIVMEAVAFQPADLSVEVGDSVVWVNKDAFPHTATAKVAFDSKEIGAEKSWQFTPAAAGEFPYVCTYHPTMKGVLRVTAASTARR